MIVTVLMRHDYASHFKFFLIKILHIAILHHHLFSRTKNPLLLISWLKYFCVTNQSGWLLWGNRKSGAWSSAVTWKTEKQCLLLVIYCWLTVLPQVHHLVPNCESFSTRGNKSIPTGFKETAHIRVYLPGSCKQSCVLGFRRIKPKLINLWLPQFSPLQM